VTKQIPRKTADCEVRTDSALLARAIIACHKQSCNPILSYVRQVLLRELAKHRLKNAIQYQILNKPLKFATWSWPLTVISVTSCHLPTHIVFNPLTPNGHYIGRTAPLTYRGCILNIYSTNIRNEHFKHAA
jgi:hypothetical protein